MIGILKAVAGVLGGAKNTEKVIDLAGEAIKGVGTWIDEKKLTEEERVKFMAEAARAHLELIKVQNEENSIRSVTRRWLAWGISASMGLAFFTSMGFALAGKDLIVDKIIELVEVFQLGWSFVAVVTLFFGVSFFRVK